MKTQKPEIQKVVFRAERRKNPEVSAVLIGQEGSFTAPLVVWDPQCGHGNGSYGWYNRTRPARPSEYAEALAALRRQYAPEYRIVVAHRTSHGTAMGPSRSPRRILKFPLDESSKTTDIQVSTRPQGKPQALRASR